MVITWGCKQYLPGHVSGWFFNQKICLKGCQECVLEMVHFVHQQGILTGAWQKEYWLGRRILNEIK